MLGILCAKSAASGGAGHLVDSKEHDAFGVGNVLY